ncbi:MAG: ATP-grasp domain-containing protein [Atopobiaceae bacterium]|nr:ATP-grasp domain-containing protein [Atopobiaceae bacterium]
MLPYRGKKVAVIGASYLQLPIIQKLQELGAEVHVFAWEANDVGEKQADVFYPISIVDRDSILNVCKEIGIDAVCTIGSDLAAITVNYVANGLGLHGNPWQLTGQMVNKHAMREAFVRGGDPSPKSFLVDNMTDLQALPISFPAIVKPTDRSGSRAVTKIWSLEEAPKAIEAAMEASFEHKAVLEDYLEGDEYSVECIAFDGEYEILAITQKFTTGEPNFIETGHIEPSNLSKETAERVRKVVKHALGTLGIQCGAAHAEVMVDSEGNPSIVEIGARMGGDFIGSHLVPLSTGIDYLRAVVDTAFGNKPHVEPRFERAAGVRFIFEEHDLELLQSASADPEISVVETVLQGELPSAGDVKDSSMRGGCFVIEGASRDAVIRYTK